MMKKIEASTIAAILRRAREERGWTFYRLAKESGLDARQIARVEAGQRTLTLPSAILLTRALGVSLSVFDAIEA